MTLDRDARPAGPELAVLARLRDALRDLPEPGPRGGGDVADADADADADAEPLLPLPRRRR